MGRSQEKNVNLPDAAAIVETAIRVRYAETDQMQVVHHANYLIWFEAARSEFCRARGIDYTQMEQEGLALPLLEAHCRYIRPARYDDDLLVRVWVAECRHSLLKMQYEVKRGQELLATGETLQILIERAAGKPRRFSPELAAKFQHSEVNGQD